MSEGSQRIRVERNIIDHQGNRPWVVRCDYCAGEGSILRLLTAPKGWAPTWRVAQDYAIRHAMAHEATRCATCLHVPEKVIDDVRVSA